MKKWPLIGTPVTNWDIHLRCNKKLQKINFFWELYLILNKMLVNWCSEKTKYTRKRKKIENHFPTQNVHNEIFKYSDNSNSRKRRRLIRCASETSGESYEMHCWFVISRFFSLPGNKKFSKKK